MTVDPGFIEGTHIPLTEQERHTRAASDVLKELEDVLHGMMLGEKLKSGGERIKQVEELKGSGGVLRPTLRKQLRHQLKKVVVDELQAKQTVKLTEAQLKDARSRADSRTDRMMAEIVDKVVSGLSGDHLTGYAQKLLRSLTEVQRDLPDRLKTITRLETQIRMISEFEFVRGLTRTKPIKFVFHTKSLESFKERLEECQEQIGDVAAKLTEKTNERGERRKGLDAGEINPTSYYLEHLAEDPGLREAVKTAEQVGATYFKSVEQLSVELANAIRDVSYEINEKALEAYVGQHDEAGEEIDAVKEHVGQAIEIVGKAVRATDTGDCFVKLAKWLTVVHAEVKKTAAIREGMDSYAQEHTKSELLREHNRDPLLLAADLQRKQKAAMEVFFSTLDLVIAGAVVATPPGTGKIVTGVWDLVSTTVQEVTKKILEERIEKAAEAARQAAVAAGETYRNGSGDGFKSALLSIDNAREGAFKGIDREIEAKLTGEIEKNVAKELNETAKDITSPETLTGIFGVAYSYEQDDDAPRATFDPFAFGTLLAKLIVPRVTAKILKFVEVPAAEVVSGDRLAGLLQDLSFSAISINIVFQQSITLPRRPEPKQFADKPEGLPTEVGSTRKPVKRVNASRSQPDRKWFYVSLDFEGVEVWGMYDAATGIWTAARPDPESYTNWSEIFIAADSITEKGVETKGSWDCVKLTEMNATVFAFRPAAGGPLRWGHLMDSVKGGPRGNVEYQLGPQINGLRGTLVRQRLIAEMPEFVGVNA